MIEMPADEIDDFLAQSRIGRLGMADRAGHPYIIPLPFCFTDRALYVRLPHTGRKGQVLQENDQVCFEVDWHTDTLDDYVSVLVEGRLVAVTDLEEKVRVKTHNEAKYERLRHGYRPGHGRQKSLRELPLQKIVITAISGRRKDPCLQKGH